MNLSTNVTFSLEDEDWNEFKSNGIPIVVFLICLCATGTVGNMHVFLVYLLKYKSNIYKTFIQCLAAVDFLGCVLGIPMSLYIIIHTYSVQSAAFCKGARTLSYFVGAYSLLLLDCIAIERYRKVCQATRAQFTLKITRVICASLCLLVIAVIIIPVAIIYGINERITKTHSLIGYECTVLDQYKTSTLIKVYRGFVFFVFVVLLIIAVVLYTLIGRKVYTHKNKLRKTDEFLATEPRVKESKQRDVSLSSADDGNKHGNRQRQDNDSGVITSAVSTPETSKSNLSHESHATTLYPNGNFVQSNVNEFKNQPKAGAEIRNLDTLKKKKRKALDKSINLTMIFLVVSIISFGGYLPYLVVTLIRNVNKSLYQSFTDNYGALDLFIRWMIFLNNAINPLVYGFMDSKFRRELTKLYGQLMSHCSVCRK
ncbi:5-hydroxytryptamine receptor 1F-like [Argopecten irradians]|uniref:5-hydroxytryptamine receptor 1F-like n=1 Tax=Argopecten irradians TaxID=31199 RepID=UPI0037147C89